MAKSETRPEKKDVARALLLRGSVFVYLDPRPVGVVVPKQFQRQAQLVLQVGLDLPVPIPDLRVDDSGIFGTLSFNQRPFTCIVPWDAVFALVGEAGMAMVWEEDLPDEIAAEVERGMERAQPAGPTLVAIDGGKPDAPELAPAPEEPSTDSDPPTDGGDAPGGRPPWLRVIK